MELSSQIEKQTLEVERIWKVLCEERLGCGSEERKGSRECVTNERLDFSWFEEHLRRLHFDVTLALSFHETLQQCLVCVCVYVCLQYHCRLFEF